jgi:hypothetical protein
MKRSSSKAASSKIHEVEPFDKRSINITRFKPDLSTKDLQKLIGPVGGIVFPFGTIDTLSVTKPSVAAAQI